MEDKKSTARLSEETAILRNYVRGFPVRRAPPYDFLRYSQVARATGLDMSPESANRDKLREAIIVEARRYEVVPNIGYILDSPENATRIGGHAQRKVVNAAIRSEATADVLIRNNGDALPTQDLKALERVRIAAGQSLAVAEASLIAKENAARIARRPKVRKSPTSIPYTPGEAISI